MSMALRAALGVTLLALAHLLGSTPEPERFVERDVASRRVASIERLLVTLAPETRALTALGLWLREEAWGDPALPPFRREILAATLLRVAPDLEGVRIDLARWFLQGRVPRERRAEIAEALASDGLRLLDDGIAQRPSPALHAALGGVLADANTRVRTVAERLFGDRVEELAIHELRQARTLPYERRRLAGLLLERGQRSLDRFGDHAAAARDLAEAEALLSLGDETFADAALRKLDELRRRLEMRDEEETSS